MLLIFEDIMNHIDKINGITCNESNRLLASDTDVLSLLALINSYKAL